LSDVCRDVPAEVKERLQVVRGNLDQIEERVRRLSHELHPRILDDLGLVNAIRFVAEGVAKRAGISITIETPPEIAAPDVMARAVYRMVQEALTNLSKHASARRAWVVVRQDENFLRCEVRDDGAGFDPCSVSERRMGLGLTGIRDRLEAIGATLEIKSEPGKGTELIALIPVEPGAPAGSTAPGRG
jgi:signal transduction histidine kinase